MADTILIGVAWPYANGPLHQGQMVGSFLPADCFARYHRLRQSLTDLREALGDRQVAVCRELTKLYEEVFRGTLSDALDHFTEPRGECTLVIEGAGKAEAATTQEEPFDVDAELRQLKAQGLRAREAVRTVAQRSGLPHREVYRRWLALSASDEPAPATS